ncbi:hypothetical protein PIB30_015573 [Stylosanthes scabra]|uniref:Uncharacterized protein n=1 Tax=Stylosanthes scabra TaxID=79078 RepID=A0ABU6Q721_9FABA|nr:hypothetical protein [Stylosanthes scabra]
MINRRHRTQSIPSVHRSSTSPVFLSIVDLHHQNTILHCQLPLTVLRDQRNLLTLNLDLVGTLISRRRSSSVAAPRSRHIHLAQPQSSSSICHHPFPAARSTPFPPFPICYTPLPSQYFPFLICHRVPSLPSASSGYGSLSIQRPWFLVTEEQTIQLCFVRFQFKNHASRVVQTLNRSYIDGSIIYVSEAKYGRGTSDNRIELPNHKSVKTTEEKGPRTHPKNPSTNCVSFKDALLGVQ